MMGWEESSRSEVICPCGKGKVLEIYESDDWNRNRTRRQILCEHCRTKYRYDDHIVIRGHVGDEIERGWVLITDRPDDKLTLPNYNRVSDLERARKRKIDRLLGKL